MTLEENVVKSYSLYSVFYHHYYFQKWSIILNCDWNF